MNWAIELTKHAEKDLERIPRDRQKRIASTIDKMESNPLDGDIKQLKGAEWVGTYRKRIGSYRIIFSINQKDFVVTIERILIRSEKTYR